MNDNGPIKITSDEVERAVLPQATSYPQTGSAPKSYGTLAIGQPSDASRGGSFWLRAWVYLGIAGFVGALLGWAICEPFFVDTNRVDLVRWGNHVMMEFVVALMCLGYALAESLAERSAQKALQRAALAIVIGAILSLGFEFVANALYNALRYSFGWPGQKDVAAWLARSIGWATFGAVCGIVYGIIGLSVKKGCYGVLGGILGAALGGIVFDPICLVTQVGGPSRAVGFALFGGFTGVAMGLVEGALKDRWLYVAGGPLAGKQFILYKQETVFGSQQSADIYLFKDPSILPEHAVLSMLGTKAVLRAAGTVIVNGQSVQETPLRSGDKIQIGRYVFDYREKQKAS